MKFELFRNLSQAARGVHGGFGALEMERVQGRSFL